MPWPQVLDQQDLRGPTSQRYQLVSVPALYLPDHDGRIVTTRLAGPALERALARHLR
jgi:hypothetical protein